MLISIRDFTWDRVYPLRYRLASSRFWTPLVVAERASEWLSYAGAARVLDIGSGVGKFCITASAHTGVVTVGIEHRPHLVEVARSAARTKGVRAARFLTSTVQDFDPAGFDGFYAFNPFSENLFEGEGCIDFSVELSESRYVRDLATIEDWLDRAPVGVALVSYHGLGGRIPGSFDLLRESKLGTGWLRLFVKRRATRRTDEFYVDRIRAHRSEPIGDSMSGR